MVLKDPGVDESRLQLNPIGPMLGECTALKIENEGLHVDAIRASYSKVGITSVKLALNGKAGNFGGEVDDPSAGQTVTDWILSEEQEFVGFEVW